MYKALRAWDGVRPRLSIVTAIAATTVIVVVIIIIMMIMRMKR